MLRIIIVLSLFLVTHLQAEFKKDYFVELYKPSIVKKIKLSPSGKYALAISMENGVNSIDAYNLETRVGGNLHYEKSNKVLFKSIDWIDDNTILVYWSGLYDKLSVYHIDYSNPNNVGLANKFTLPISGRVIHNLPREENKIIFSKNSESHGVEKFYKLDLSEKLKKNKYFSRSNKLNMKFKNVTDWAFDADDEVRFIEVQTKKEFIYYYRKKGSKKWTESARATKEDLNYYYAIDQQDKLIALVKENDDRRIIAYYDPETMQQTSVAYEHPVYDVHRPIVDFNKKLIGAVIVNQGELEHIYFAEELNNLKNIIKQRKNQSKAFIIDSNLDNNKFLLLASSNGFHYRYYDYDLLSDKLKLTRDPRPWLKFLDFSKTETFTIPSADGREIEAYLTLPLLSESAFNYPLIVNPHGGPFGVRDYKFNKETQLLAAHGYAVLRTNFRGSSGFGDKHRDSAKQGLGTIIEQDVFDSLQYALGKYPIDKSKICAMGTSYGGYSTAMLMAQHPEVFKCGVSFAGVFDLNLQINEAKRYSSYKESLDEYFKEYIADLELNPDLQKSKSPIYYADHIQAPLLLLHGTDDQAVDIEQSYRMHYAMEKADKESELVILDGFPHGFDNNRQRLLFYKKVIPFLEEHLEYF